MLHAVPGPVVGGTAGWRLHVQDGADEINDALVAVFVR